VSAWREAEVNGHVGTFSERAVPDTGKLQSCFDNKSSFQTAIQEMGCRPAMNSYK
jgi:hypothetical protein